MLFIQRHKGDLTLHFDQSICTELAHEYENWLARQ
jgi:hypothetical protein